MKPQTAGSLVKLIVWNKREAAHFWIGNCLFLGIVKMESSLCVVGGSVV